MRAENRVEKIRRALLWLSVAALVLGAVPLYAISLYNHPYYDDYGFSARARTSTPSPSRWAWLPARCW